MAYLANLTSTIRLQQTQHGGIPAAPTCKQRGSRRVAFFVVSKATPFWPLLLLQEHSNFAATLALTLAWTHQTRALPLMSVCYFDEHLLVQREVSAPKT